MRTPFTQLSGHRFCFQPHAEPLEDRCVLSTLAVSAATPYTLSDSTPVAAKVLVQETRIAEVSLTNLVSAANLAVSPLPDLVAVRVQHDSELPMAPALGPVVISTTLSLAEPLQKSVETFRADVSTSLAENHLSLGSELKRSDDSASGTPVNIPASPAKKDGPAPGVDANGDESKNNGRVPAAGNVKASPGTGSIAPRPESGSRHPVIESNPDAGISGQTVLLLDNEFIAPQILQSTRNPDLLLQGSEPLNLGLPVFFGEERSVAEGRLAGERVPQLNLNGNGIVPADDNETDASQLPGPLTGGVPFDQASMDNALQQFLDELTGLMHDAVSWRSGLLAWLFMGLTVTAATFELVRRRKQRDQGQQLGTGNGAGSVWH